MLIKNLYQNYNSVNLYEENGKKIVRKIFSNEFLWENETKVINFLKSDFPVPKILNIGHMENTYEFSEEESFSKLLKDFPERVELMLDLFQKFSSVSQKGFYKFTDGKSRLIRRSKELYEKEKIDLNLLNKLEKVSSSYSFDKKRFIHGDFRPSNILGENEVKMILDFEFSGIDDPNKDLAYLWIGAVEIDKSLNPYLKKRFETIEEYDEKSFDFWLAYIHVMIMSNPKNNNLNSWRINLEQVLN